MKLTRLLASSAALATFALALPLTVVPAWSPIATAEAATSISFSVFYEGLDNDGDWISHNGDYVFVPVITDRNWQPYTKGRWVHASGYGWTWASDERFGWATYHYGRWGFDQEIGWYWVPGTRWAPAWVSWRRSGDHVSWAPLPPRRGGGDDISINVTIGSIPDYYWVAVPSRRFLDVDLSVVAIYDDRERRRIVSGSEFVGSVQVENNVIVNNVININFIEKTTGKKVKNVKVEKSDNPAGAKTNDEQVQVFEGNVEPDKAAKPAKIKDVAAVKSNQIEPKKKVKAEATGDENSEVEAGKTGEEAPGTTKSDAKLPESQPTESEGQSDNQADEGKTPVVEGAEGENADTPTENTKSAAEKAEDSITDESVETKKKPAAADAGDDAAAAPAEKTKKENVKKQKASSPDAEDTPDSAVEPKQKQPAEKKAKAEKPAADGEGQPEEAQPDVTKKAAQKDKADTPASSAVPCDPAADMATQQGCVAQ